MPASAEALWPSHAAHGSKPFARQDEERIVLQNGLFKVAYNRHTGKMDIHWRKGHHLLGVESGAQLADGRMLQSSNYSSHTLDSAVGSYDAARQEYKFTIRNVKSGTPFLLQHIWLHEDKPWISIQAELDSEAGAIGTRHFSAVRVQEKNAIQLNAGMALRMLRVPFDNDMWVRYDSMPVTSMQAGQTYGSCEVTAIYDNASREALILGAITHDVWKTAIDVEGSDDQISSLDIYGGISPPLGARSVTHDVVPHGVVHGGRVLSPRVFIGSFEDWREGLEAYGAANAEIQPPLVWPAGAPMGWNSWAAYADKIDYSRYLGAADYMRDVLVPQGFGRDNVVYINFDAFWSRLDAVQLEDAVKIVTNMEGRDGVQFKPGIYWTPFAYWSDDLGAYVEGTDGKYRYRDILLQAPDGSYMPKVDGGRPIDPSSPGALERISYSIREFKKLGFTYLKLDFLSHGALEGAHRDASVRTGIEAYNKGMQKIVQENEGKMFLSLSIAPIFPAGCGHSRRISCDTKGHISGKDQSTEYMLNSLTYGWWTSGNLFIADPDHVVLGVKADQGARSIVEGRSRLLSAIISGGMILDSSRLADDPDGRAFAKAVYDNRNLFAIASQQKAFRPVEGDTGDHAAAAFVLSSGSQTLLAVFNYDDKQPQTINIPMGRINADLGAAPIVSVKDIASGKHLTPMHATFSITLAPAESKLVSLSL